MTRAGVLVELKITSAQFLKFNEMMYLKEIIQFISLPVMIYVVYKLAYWLYIKLEKKNFLK